MLHYRKVVEGIDAQKCFKACKTGALKHFFLSLIILLW